jgi:hypothetical protein
MTGVLALERNHPGFPMSADRVEMREFEYYNRTMAKPFKWTYQGNALNA